MNAKIDDSALVAATLKCARLIDGVWFHETKKPAVVVDWPGPDTVYGYEARISFYGHQGRLLRCRRAKEKELVMLAKGDQTYREKS